MRIWGDRVLTSSRSPISIHKLNVSLHLVVAAVAGVLVPFCLVFALERGFGVELVGLVNYGKFRVFFCELCSADLAEGWGEGVVLVLVSYSCSCGE